MKEVATSRGGKCLSLKYINNGTKLHWQCRQGHQWKAIPGSVLYCHWCKVCADKSKGEKRKNDIGIYQKIALQHGGKLLTNEYINNHAPMKWKCSKGHIWQAPGNRVQCDGSWCPYCSLKIKHTIEDMRQLAKKRRGRCLSSFYVNNKTKVKWQCSKGHVWMSKPNSVISGYWCPECAGKLKHTIEKMQSLAKSHGGKCVSSAYKNSRTPLKWQCKAGHTWNAKPMGIVQGQWCRACYYESRRGTQQLEITTAKPCSFATP